MTSDESWDSHVEGIDIVFHIPATFQEVEKFVHCSTVGVHGDVKEIPCTEKTPFNPMDIYHQTKLRGELLLMEFAESLGDDGMVVTVNRPAMVYGPGDTRMMQLFQAIFRCKFVMIDSGEVLVHLGYIDDQVDSLILYSVSPRSDVHMEAFNIASGQPITLNSMTKMIASEAGVKLPRLHIPVWLIRNVAWACDIMWKPFGTKPLELFLLVSRKPGTGCFFLKLSPPTANQVRINIQTSSRLRDLVALIRHQRHGLTSEILGIITALSFFCCHRSPRHGILQP